jgi:peptide/nickel transport system substrate-binding protein
MERSRRAVREQATPAVEPRRPRAGARRPQRTWLALGAALIAGSSLAACGSSSSSTATTSGSSSGSSSSGTPDPNGVVKYGVDLNETFSGTFDPAQSTDDCSYTEYTALYDSLLAPGNDNVSPLLAASYTATPTSITFHLQPGAKFSNGDPVTASTVEASINHIKTSPFRFSLTYIQSMQVVNPETVTFTLNKPVAGDVLWAMTYIDGMQLDPAALPTSTTVPASSGPFTLTNYQQGSSMTLKANPTYWDKSAYKLGGVEFVQVSPGPQEVSALESGAVDMLPLQPEDYTAVKDLPDVGIATTSSADYLVMQTRQNQAPFNDPKVRAALEYAVDRNAINTAVFSGLGEPAFQPFPSSSAGYNKSVGQQYTYQPAKAKAMLAAAGHPNGINFTLVIPTPSATFSRTAQILQAEMAPAGFKVSIQQVNGADLFTEVYEHGEGDAVLSEELTNGPDLANNFESEYTGVGFAGTQLGDTNPTLTPLVDQALTSLSPSVQGPPMQEASKIAMATGTEVPLIFEPSVVAYNKSRVGGNVVAPIGSCRSDLAGIYIKKG